MEVCFEYEIEVDKNQCELNSAGLSAQERFILSFVADVYKDIDSHHAILSKIASFYFTRIFNPQRDKMGAYVRLRLFAEEVDFQTIKTEIDRRLGKLPNDIPIFQVKKTDIDWPKDCEQYGGRAIAPLFRDYLNSTSRICYQLILSKGKGVNVECVLWPWTHLFFNMICGESRSVVEFPIGAVTNTHIV